MNRDESLNDLRSLDDEFLFFADPLVEFLLEILDGLAVCEDTTVEKVASDIFQRPELSLREPVADWLAVVPPDGPECPIADCGCSSDCSTVVLQAKSVGSVGGHLEVAVYDVERFVMQEIQLVGDNLLECEPSRPRIDTEWKRR